MSWKVHWKKIFQPLNVITILVVVVLDQYTKYLVVENIPMGSRIPITSWFNLVHTKNRGAAFGMFHDSSDLFRMIFFGAVTIGCLYLLLLWISDFGLDQKLQRFLLSLIFGGAVGNVIDRVIYGEVTDFIDWYYGTYHWPAFNIADSAISVGAVWFVLLSIKKRKSD